MSDVRYFSDRERGVPVRQDRDRVTERVWAGVIALLDARLKGQAFWTGLSRGLRRSR